MTNLSPISLATGTISLNFVLFSVLLITRILALSNNRRELQLYSSSGLTFTQCVEAMVIADELKNDDSIGRDEYVAFVNAMSGNVFYDNSFSELPGALKDNYEKLAIINDGNIFDGSKNDKVEEVPGIHIYGSKPEQISTLSPLELQHLMGICKDTDSAIGQVVTSTSALTPTFPTASPLPESKRYLGIVHIVNSFVISNNQEFDGAALHDGGFYSAIQEAYVKTIRQVISGENVVTFCSKSEQRQGMNRNCLRKLGAFAFKKIYLPEDTTITGVWDTLCDRHRNSSPRKFCQEVVGKFHVRIYYDDVDAVRNQLQESTKKAIDQGILQKNINDSTLRVVEKKVTAYTLEERLRSRPIINVEVNDKPSMILFAGATMRPPLPAGGEPNRHIRKYALLPFIVGFFTCLSLGAVLSVGCFLYITKMRELDTLLVQKRIPPKSLSSASSQQEWEDEYG